MARHGENIRKRKDGRWEGRYLEYHEATGKQKYRSIYGRTYEETKERLIFQKSRQGKLALGYGKESAEENRAKREATANKISFSSIAKEWLIVVKMTKKPSTYVKYHFIYRNYLETAFQDISISMVTDCLAREKISDPLSESMGKSIYCVLNQVLKFASQKHSIAIPYLKRPVSHASKKPVETLSRKEQSRLFLELYQGMDRLKAAVLLCLHTGLRLGELCALKWEDLDAENQIIAVNRTVQRLYVKEGHKKEKGEAQNNSGKEGNQRKQKYGKQNKTALVETDPKSVHSKREIPLPPAVITLLEQFWNGEEYIFGGDKPVDPRTMQNRFRKILKSAGVKHKNFHTLRHTFSTNCIEGGTDVKSLSELLGHSDVQITLNRYVHPSMDTKRKHLDALSTFYGQIHGQSYGQAS